VAHGNARLTVHARRTVVDRVLVQGRPQAHVAKEMGVSRQCVSRWIQRFRCEGDQGLYDRSSRPHHCPTRTSSQVEDQVVRLRGQEPAYVDLAGTVASDGARLKLPPGTELAHVT
jgi:transposase